MRGPRARHTLLALALLLGMGWRPSIGAGLAGADAAVVDGPGVRPTTALLERPPVPALESVEERSGGAGSGPGRGAAARSASGHPDPSWIPPNRPSEAPRRGGGLLGLAAAPANAPPRS